jgi:hypothetical protein
MNNHASILPTPKMPAESKLGAKGLLEGSQPGGQPTWRPARLKASPVSLQDSLNSEVPTTLQPLRTSLTSSQNKPTKDQLTSFTFIMSGTISNIGNL